MAGFAAVSTFSLFSLLFLVSLTTAIVIKPQQPFISLRQRNSYRAAAFQLSSVASPNRSPKENIEDTLQVFRVAAANASQEFQPEVMVFPEAILWSTGLARGRETIGDYAEEIPSPEAVTAAFCDSDDSLAVGPQLRSLSCIAKSCRSVVAANVIQTLPCQKGDVVLGVDCPADGVYYFNAEVIFESDGKLIALYRKRHLFATSVALQQPKIAEETIFTAKEIGVTFGVFTCFDIEFSEPAVALYNKGVRNFLFSSSWFNGPPLTVALTYQQAFSRLYDSNLIASNVGTTGFSSGSGIYSKGNALSTVFDPLSVGDQTVVWADVPLFEKEREEFLSEGTTFSAIKREETEKEKMGENEGKEAKSCGFEGVFEDLIGSCLSLENGKATKVKHGRVECSATASFSGSTSRSPSLFSSTPSSTSATPSPSSILFAFAFDGTLDFPSTPQSLALTICGIVSCSAKQNEREDGQSSDVLTCVADYNASSMVSVATVEAFLPSYSLVFPTVSDKACL